jgi:hypothetical protein
MIGKPEWFTYRTFGWGIAPKNWKGWIYVAAVAFIIGLTMSVTILDSAKIWVFSLVFGVIILDIIHIMTQLPKVHDERQNLHQLIIERNVSFAAVATLAAVALFQTYQNKDIIGANQIPFDISLLVILGAMFLTKIISVIYVKAKV